MILPRFRLGWCLPLFLLALLPAAPLAAASPSAIEKVDVFVSGTEGYHTFRIPAILRAANGDLLAFCEGRKTHGGDAGDIDLLLKRSSDGGKTWGKAQVVWDDADNTCGNPNPVLDRTTGTVWLLSTHNLGADKEAAIVNQTAQGSRTVWILKSDDHGATWSAPKEITSSVKLPSWRWYATGPGVGIQIESGPKAGRLVIPCDFDYHTEEKHAGRGSHAIYSDDHGATWKIGGLLQPKMNECQVVELFDGKGTLLMDMRSYRGTQVRAQATSADGGETWSEIVDVPALVEPVCQASIVRWPTSPGQGRILFSNPADPKKRLKLTVRASDDNAATWSKSLLLHAGPAAYSCLVALDPDTAACFYENGDAKPYERITFARFRSADLTATP